MTHREMGKAGRCHAATCGWWDDAGGEEICTVVRLASKLPARRPSETVLWLKGSTCRLRRAGQAETVR